MGSFTTTSRTWVIGETVTAANLNAQLKGLIDGFGAWTTYTPTITASGTAFAIGNGTTNARYRQVGKDVALQVIIKMGTTTTFGTGTYVISLPVALSASTDGGAMLGSAGLVCASVAYNGRVTYGTSTANVKVLAQSAITTFTQWGATTPGTTNATDSVTFSLVYESA